MSENLAAENKEVYQRYSAAGYFDKHFLSHEISHWYMPELSVEEAAKYLGIDPARMHKTVVVTFWIHDIRSEEIVRIKNGTMGEAKGLLHKFAKERFAK